MHTIATPPSLLGHRLTVRTLTARAWPCLVAATALALAACTSVPTKPAPQPPAKTSSKPSPSKGGDANSVALPTKPGEGWEPAPRGGGYYQDDGPADWRPTNLAELPMAEPQVEPIAVDKTKPYVVMGQQFVPQTSLETPFKQKGRASWYGRKFHGQKTANGEIYDMHQMTAAHPTLPLPSYAKVTNPSNGRWVIVRVNDRGPFLRNRIIDLSYAAAYKLDYIHHGSVEVVVEKLTPEDIAAYRAGKLQDGVLLASAPGNTRTPANSPSATSRGALFLQIGAFSRRGNAENLLTELGTKNPSLANGARILSEANVHRVLLGPFASLDHAQQTSQQVVQHVAVQPVVKQDLVLP